MRISRHQMFMDIANVVAKRSSCARLNVGAVVVVNDRIVSIGYNGPPAGAPHCSPTWCRSGSPCQRAVHAEINALMHVPESAVPAHKTMYLTDSPCLYCWEDMTRPDHCVDAVYYQTLYRVNNHLAFSGSIKLYRLTPSGFIIDHATGEIIEGT